MRTILITVAALLCAPAAASAAAGGVDTRFGVEGLAAVDASGAAASVAVQPDGKIVVAGRAGEKFGSPAGALVARFNADGAPDAGFGVNGRVLLDVGQHAEAEAVAVRPDGKIVVAGSIQADAIVYRLTPTGDLDDGFEGDGRVRLDHGVSESAHALAVQPDGKLVVVGARTPTTKSDAVVYRLTEQGALDTTFDTDGVAMMDTGGSEVAQAVALLPDGKIVVAASTTDGASLAVFRLLAAGGTGATNGALDRTFDGDGVAGFSLGATEDGGVGIAVEPSGRILVATHVPDRFGVPDAAVFAVRPHGGIGVLNGALDPDFGDEGVAAFDDNGNHDVAEALALQPDGRIVVAGGSTAADETKEDGFVYRLLPDGRQDPAFAGGPVERPGYQKLFDAALHPDGRIVAVGKAYTPDTDTFFQPFALRVLGDPATLTVRRDGAGSGTVASSPAGIACGPVCAAPFDVGTPVTLQVEPAPGSTFAGWRGACGTAPSCTLTVEHDTEVTALFAATPLEGEDDTVPPRVAPKARIDRGPKSRVKTKRRRAKVTFRLSADQPGATFECRVGTRPFRACAATVKLTVRRGRHRFQARALGPGGTGPLTSRAFRVVGRRR